MSGLWHRSFLTVFFEFDLRILREQYSSLGSQILFNVCVQSTDTIIGVSLSELK